MEYDRSTALQCRTIYLHKDGKFYRAYQMSAWLYSKSINAYKVTHRRFKSVEETVAFIGFPTESLMKWIPDGFEVDGSDERLVRISVPDDVVADICSGSEVQAAYKSWKESQPLNEPYESVPEKSKSPAPPNVTKRMSPSMFGIMQQILAFPIESKSPIDCMLFLAEVRQSLANHF